MKKKMPVKKNLFIIVFSITYFYSVLFAFPNQILSFIGERILGYSKPNDFGHLDYIPPMHIAVPTLVIYVAAIALIYILVLRLAKKIQ